MAVKEENGFSPSTGIYQSKWPSPTLPAKASSFPLHLFSQISPRHSTKPAFIDAATGHSITFADLQKLTNSTASYLRSLGIKKGDVVLLISQNSIHFPIILLSIMSVGAIFSTSNYLNTRKEIETQVHDSNPVLIITTQNLLPKLQGLTSRPPVLAESLITNNSTQNSSVHTEEDRGHEPQDVAAIMYSSGTTGKSKGVVLTHDNLINMSHMVGHVLNMGSSDHEVYMCVVPMFHMFGISMILCGSTCIGSTVVVMEKFDISGMIMNVDRYGVTNLPVAPPVVVQLLRLASQGRKFELRSVKEVISSGAPLPKEHLDKFRNRFPTIALSQVYGLTETGLVTLCDVSESRFDESSSGRLLPSFEAKIVAVDTKMPLPPNKCGELQVRGPSVMQGYWKNQEATCHAIDREGWFHTGDLCFIDSSGGLHIVDRLKELIKYKAYQVAPVELEEILLTHPGISDVAIISHSDDEAGEIPVACVVRKPGHKIREYEIIHFVESKVAPFKKIRKVIFVDKIPRSASGKILRRELKASTTSNHIIQLASRL